MSVGEIISSLQQSSSPLLLSAYTVPVSNESPSPSSSSTKALKEKVAEAERDAMAAHKRAQHVLEAERRRTLEQGLEERRR